MENQNLQKKITQFLKEKPIHMVELSSALAKKFQIHMPSDEVVAYNLRLLREKDFVDYSGELHLGSMLRLTEKGVRSLDHWLRKLGRFFKKNSPKILGGFAKLFLRIVSCI